MASNSPSLNVLALSRMILLICFIKPLFSCTNTTPDPLFPLGEALAINSSPKKHSGKPLSLPLSLSHTHTHTYTLSPTHPPTHTHTHTHTCTHTHTHTHTRAHKHTHSTHCQVSKGTDVPSCHSGHHTLW